MRRLLLLALMLAPLPAAAGIMDEQYFKYRKSLENMSHFLGNGDLQMACAAAGDADFYLRAYLVDFQQGWPDTDWYEQRAGVKDLVDYCDKKGL